MSYVYNSSDTATTINRAIDNSQGTTTTEQGAAAAGKIIKEDLSCVVQCTGGYMNPMTKKTISGEPPLQFHAVDAVLYSWIIAGNVDSGNYVGDLTANLMQTYTWKNSQTDTKTNFNLSITVYSGSTGLGERRLDVTSNGYITLTSAAPTTTYDKIIIKHNGSQRDLTIATITGSFEANTPVSFSCVVDGHDPTAVDGIDLKQMMLVTGATAKPWEPYNKYKIPIKCGGTTTNAYIDAPLRMSSGEDPVCDIMYSDGTITINVDTDGTPLETPTTGAYTPVTISTVGGYNTFDVDTTVSPSTVSVTYIDN